MAPRARKTKRKSSLKVRVKQDPVLTAKQEINKTGALKYPIGAYIIGALGGAGAATAMTQIPIVGNLLSVFAKKGASLTASFKK